MEIRPTLRTSFSPSGDKLRIVTVQREDKGIYQCFVKSDLDMAQAAAELRLGGKILLIIAHHNKSSKELLRNIKAKTY